jgi:hypothetical protein
MALESDTMPVCGSCPQIHIYTRTYIDVYIYVSERETFGGNLCRFPEAGAIIEEKLVPRIDLVNGTQSQQVL